MFWLAITEKTFWSEAQAKTVPSVIQSAVAEVTNLSQRLVRWYFTDGSWKKKENYSKYGWYSTLVGVDGFMGEKCMTKFHLGYENHKELTTFLRNLCNRLFSDGEDGFGTRKMTCIAIYLEDIRILERSFSHSGLLYLPRIHNKWIDNLVRNVWKQLSYVVHIESELLVHKILIEFVKLMSKKNSYNTNSLDM